MILPKLKRLTKITPHLLLSIGLNGANSLDLKVIDELGLQVVGGIDADIDDYPWMGAMVLKDPEENTKNFCGCTAIDPYWVLTAAHCVEDGRELEDFQIVFGTADLTNNENAKVFYPSAIIQHPDYVDIFSRTSDIALIQLRNPLPPEIPLVTLVTNPLLEEPGRTARLIGWGITNTDKDNPVRTEILQEVDTPIVSMEFANDPAYWNGRIKETMIAAGGTGPYSSSGSGDSGGPLLAYNSEFERWEQIGISSWGGGCSKPDNPISAYTQVSHQLDWINNIVAPDFLSWTIENGIADLNFDDGDYYSPLFEYMFLMDPTKADEPTWLHQYEIPSDGYPLAIYSSMNIRSNIPKFGLSFEKSEDLNHWDKVNLLWESVKEEDFPDTLSSKYVIPVVENDYSQGFYRIKHEDLSGIHHGPFPLREGFETSGVFNQGSAVDGPTRYDYRIENFGSSQSLILEIRTDNYAPIRIQVIDVKTDIVTYDSIKGDLDISPLSLTIEPLKEQQNVIRIESAQWTIPQTFWISSRFKFDNSLQLPGNSVSGILSSDNISYRRNGHYADSRSYTLSGGINYKIEMRGEDLDPVFFLKDRRKIISLADVDNETPGKPEIFLFRPNENMDADIIVSSWFPKDTGDWSLYVDPYTEPENITIGETITGFGTPGDEEHLQNGLTFFFDWYSLKNVNVAEGITVVVRGREGYEPQFAVTNNTEKVTLFLDRIDCSVRSFYFVPQAENNYSVVVLSPPSGLGKNYEVEIFQGDHYGVEAEEGDTMNKLLQYPNSKKEELFRGNLFEGR
jgi:hypothetical protein